ncbi:PREDICTED: pickpocket protein 19-like [Bactrocera latifrons]|uniref:pickpocket protein 19-like n=1 Tax=Bactrocera latifrons TaxID=174628 RepID=UPI0008DC7641|nr:PREDICTED: pickpocket protein 19-like [Bactrocera latifrons]
MVYPARFQASQANALQLSYSARHTPLPQKPRMIIQLPSWKSIRRTAGEISASAWELAFRFGQSTTIHGVNRLFSRSAGKYERFVWFLTVMLALLGAIYVSHLLSDRFSEGRLETVVDSTRYPIYHISFPVVAICNMNQLNWERLEEAKRRYLEPDTTPENQELFERVIGSFDGIHFAGFESFLKFQNISLDALNYVNFTEVMIFMTWRCEELLSECIWNHFPMNCCDIFSLRRSKNGLCWAFNTLETDEGRQRQKVDPLWPWHTGAAGPGSGLMVRVDVNAEKQYPRSTNEKGVKVMIVEPNVWHMDPMNIPENTHTMIEVEPVVYFYDNNTRGLGSKLRECIFDDEEGARNVRTLQGYVYMIENCQSECHQQYLVKFCNCTMDLLFPPGPYPTCRAKDLVCLAQNNEHFLYSHRAEEELYVHNYHEGMVCECFRNCYSLNYVSDARPSFLPPEMHDNHSYIFLDVHFRFETMMVYRTSLIFGWVDLMVAFGGIAGLFLGCSLISTMELAYFLLVDLPTFMLQKYRNKKGKMQDKKRSVVGPMEQLQVKTNNWTQIQQFNMKNQLIHPQSYESLYSNSKMNKKLPLITDWQSPPIAKIHY